MDTRSGRLEKLLPRVVGVSDLPQALTAALRLDDRGRPGEPLVLVDLDLPVRAADDVAAAARAARSASAVVVGMAEGRVEPLLWPVTDELAFTLVGSPAVRRSEVSTDDIETSAVVLTAAAAASPCAAVTLNEVLRLTATCATQRGLVAESLAYSMLLAGNEFRRWLAARPARAVPDRPAAPVLLSRENDVLAVTINVPERRNAFSVAVRDGLIDAFDLAVLDTTIRSVVVRGAGPAFCSGGDLDEFGTSPDVGVAHLIRLERSVAARVHACHERVEVHLHGACIGAGIEIPAFADRIVAHPDTFVQLPELAMGLIPGAGGTVGITARIGRWRTAYLAFTGTRLDARTALEWGLVDAVDS